MPGRHNFKYNKEEFDDILKNIREKKFNYALEELTNYLKKYPYDVCGYLYYASILIITNKFLEAEEILNNKIVSTATVKEDIEKAFYLKIQLYICQKRYQECYDYIRENIYLFYNQEDDRDIEIMLFLKRQLKMELDNREDLSSYFMKQIVDYQENAMFSHIGKYLYTNNNENKNQFVYNFPIREVYKKVIDLIPNDLKINDGTLINTYIFKYDRCGVVDGRMVNYFKVVTIANSNQVTTIFPYENRGRLAYTDLNSISLEEDNKIKILSQVDKFNLRYKKR